MITKRGSAEWQGEIKTGTGAISTESGALKAHPYGFTARFEGGPGTNPEELIGAAHAGCFSMALSKGLAEAGATDVRIQTEADVTLDPKALKITRSALTCRISGTGDEAAMRKAAQAAKEGCPVSQVLDCEITLDLTIN